MKHRKGLIVFFCILYLLATVFSAVSCTSKDIPNEEKEEEIEEVEEEVEEEVRASEVEGELVFSPEAERTTIDVPFESTDFEAKVPNYKVESDLSNVVNLDQFGDFTEEQKALLVKNGFFVNPTEEEQLFYIYENNEYKKLPAFVTTDSVLQVYHIFYDYSLRTLENEKLIGFLEELTETMLYKSIDLYNSLENKGLKEIQLKNIAYFSVAQLSLEKELPQEVPPLAKELAEKEYALVKAEGGFATSKIFPYDLDYSQYKPRGHYTRNDDLKRYFRGMMWYGQGPFPLYKNKEGDRNIEQTLQALLITYSFFLKGDDTINLWENIYEPTYFYVGLSDDLTLYQYRDLLVNVYGETPDINHLDDKDMLDALYREAEKLPEPKIQAKYTSVTTPVGKQFRLMGQRYIPDSEIIQEMVEPIARPIPSGLDVMAVLGSERAYDIQININKEHEKWGGYVEAFNTMRDQFDQVSDGKWRSNMYYGWLWTLKGFLKDYEEGYPAFMRNEAWMDKSLSTALGSWSELKHDTVLYGKQSGVECGGGVEPPKIRGYVEPNIEVYEKLLWLTQYSKTNLKARDILTGTMESKLQQFEDLLEFLINCSVKELRNEELTEDEYYQLLTYGGMLEYLTSSFAGDHMRWFEITNDTDKNMAIISDIHTIAPNEMSPGGYFEVGVGPAQEIFVVVPIDGELYLTRGAVFSYHEFTANERLTDEAWQEILKEDKGPKQPQWMNSFIRDGKEEIPLPVDPYESGC